ncbi:glutamyl-tRNA synthetase/nondiscriminating glutamyl-tRNA synthetase [Desulfurobacterium pacificum]|uniref:Glutamate--tRNA ligase n=1 Tax=Desulfurobacterium pacificum TaxID=240166 RepID=A0ABY1NGR6_9BACT|nr:glutamate--tRNA ligase [Desulfurobacterium pacificum]SMP08630.1 glutamyl-tRNA synthetase/nondiscriminating glutamyl-tRNA synthetase [Desulfurobacterium pacificum]
MTVRVRFAPSPTGFMHVGNARTALFNYLFARHNKGKLILRIEDTDIERHSEEAVNVIYEALKWMGIEWDEGPDVGGNYGPYRQSQRLDIYRQYINKLKEKGLVYECFCTQEELEAMRQEQLKKGEPPRYTGKCRNLIEEQKKKFLEEGRKPVLRFKVPEDRTIVFNDLIKGRISINSKQLGGDFVIVRSNGMPVYNFVVVIDDALMKITHVIRGEDHISNTPKQILLYEALGFKTPEFAHLPMILGKDRSKLSKRHGSTSVKEFKEKGYLSEAFTNFLALLGWYPKDGKEILSMEELIERFDIKDVNSAPAVFDTTKLNWMNQVYIRNYPIEKLTDLIIPYLQKAGYDINSFDRKWLEKVVEITREYFTVLSDAPEYMEVFLKDEFNFEEKALNFMKESENRLKVVEELLKVLKAQEKEITQETFKEAVKQVGKTLKVKGKELFMPIRIALTGKMSGVEVPILAETLGKERVIKRLEYTLNKLKD